MDPETPNTTFQSLSLAEPILRAIDGLGYETATPIQAECIPPLLEGRDVIGQAQTGTGKTAAFALPLLSRIDLQQRDPQVLILTPTRELALQVAEALQTYARHLRDFHVLPVYGGQGMNMQLRQLRRGAHVIVGTPGRVMDHLRRGSLNLSGLTALVLDEADEMLNMGFVEDIEWIFDQAPKKRQVALFSATMPQAIRRVANKYLHDPIHIKVASKTMTGSNITQHHCVVTGPHKLDLLTRILEVEEFDAMLIFVRTRTLTMELAEKLTAHGLAAEPLNGDMSQDVRERTVNGLKRGRLDIVVATDVAARGLDVDRISHVVNYDIPNNPEAYVHRIGRTGRAGREGNALLFVNPRERHLLRAIERSTGQRIEPMELPSADALSKHRVDRFVSRLRDTLRDQDMDYYYRLVACIEKEHEISLLDIAASLTYLSQGEKPFEVKELTGPRQRRDQSYNQRDRGRDGGKRHDRRPAGPRSERPSSHPGGESRPSYRDRNHAQEPQQSQGRSDRPHRDWQDSPPDKRGSDRSADRGYADRERRSDYHDGPNQAPGNDDRRPGADIKRLPYRIAVGSEHGVAPGEIVGAIANELGLDGKHIGRIDIHDRYSVVGLPEGMPPEVFKHLRKVRVRGETLRARLWDEDGNKPRGFGDQASDRDGHRPPHFGNRDTGFRKPKKTKGKGGKKKKAGRKLDRP